MQVQGLQVILSFCKRENRPIDMDRDWIHLDTNEDGITLNSYFVDNTEMILGKMEMKSGPFGMESTCTPFQMLTFQNS